jgi:CRISPR-associated protein Cmr5
MRNIDKYIPVALNVLADTSPGILRKDGKIDKTYNGYISSFGASIITSGLLPTFIFYSKKAENSNDADRSLILKAIEMMLKKTEPGILSASDSILNKVIADYNDNRFKQKIQECAIALKLAIRTYPQFDKD